MAHDKKSKKKDAEAVDSATSPAHDSGAAAGAAVGDAATEPKKAPAKRAPKASAKVEAAKAEQANQVEAGAFAPEAVTPAPKARRRATPAPSSAEATASAVLSPAGATDLTDHAAAQAAADPTVPMTAETAEVPADLPALEDASPAVVHATTSEGSDPELILPTVPDETLQQIASGTHSGPHSVLGQHPVEAPGVTDPVVVIRALRPLADTVTAVLSTGARVALGHIGWGVWQGTSILGFQDYEIEASYPDGTVWTVDDPYRYLPSIGEMDLYLFGEGRHERLWTVMGAHTREHFGVDVAAPGTAFTVWAPHARAVRVLGDFNGWNGLLHSMRRLDANGIWELFVPGLAAGTSYKFEILTAAGHWIEKADPMAQYTEIPPATASVVGESDYVWGDAAWLSARASHDPHNQPMWVYELHFGSWRQGLGYRELADQLIDYIHETGYTHVEFMPLAEHPFGGSWGYQVSGYYAPTSRFGHPDDLRFLIDRLHQARIGVLMDWVPGHFPKDDFALARFDGQPLYEHSDPRRGEQMDWGTLVFDFGESHVRNFLVANALYWLEEFHIDGLRVDAVASMLYLDYSRKDGEWLPNQLRRPGEPRSDQLPAGGQRDRLQAVSRHRDDRRGVDQLGRGHPPHRRRRPGLRAQVEHGLDERQPPLHRRRTRCTARTTRASSPSPSSTRSARTSCCRSPTTRSCTARDRCSARCRATTGRSSPTSAPSSRTSGPTRARSCSSWARSSASPPSGARSADSTGGSSTSRCTAGCSTMVSQLNRVYRENPAFWEQDNTASGFCWIDGSDAANSVVSFLRWDRAGNPIAFVFNFSGNTLSSYRVGLPYAGVWEELLNTDAEEFGGSGVGNFGAVTAGDHGHQGQPASVELTVPPLGVLFLRPRG